MGLGAMMMATYQYVLVLTFCLAFGIATLTENMDSELCRQDLTNFEPNVGDLIEYRVLLDQAIAARRIRTGSREELLNLTDRSPADPYAHLEGSLVLVPKCYRNETHGKKNLYEAYLRNVKISCLNQNEPLHYDECRSNLGPLEAALKPFWFTQSSHGFVSDFRTPHYETDEVRAFEYGIAQLFGITPGNCSSMSVGSTNIVQIVHQDGGFHGRDPSRQMKFHSLRVHGFTFQTHGVGTRRQRPFISLTSRAMYALDVHGAAKSGRVRDHHFVHTSLKLEIKDYHEAPVLSGTSAMPPALSACTSDHFLENYSNFNNVENDTPLEFVETEMSGSRGKKARKSRGKTARKSKQKKQKKQTKHNVEDRAELRGIDITKAVTSCIDVLTRVRDGIRTGLVIIDEGINTVDDYRRKLFSEEDGKVYEVMDIVKSVAETVDRIDQKIQYFKKAVTKPDSPERKELVQDIKNLAANRMKLMTKQVRKVVHFSHSYVVKMLDEFKEYPPTFMKNLKPMTDVIAKVLQVIGPALSGVQKEGANLGKPEFALSMLPKSFVMQITGGKAYKILFGKDGQGGVIGKLAAIAKGDKDAISSKITDFILETVRDIADIVREIIDEKLTEFEIKMRKGFNLLLDEVVAKGAPKIAKYVEQVAEISTEIKTGLAAAIKKAEETIKHVNAVAKKIIGKCREMYGKAKEYVHIVLSHMDEVIKLLSEGKSFSSDKQYRVGLMKGWSVVAKAAATVAVGALPTPNVQTKASVGISYEATGPEREGNIVEISMSPAASLENTVNSLGKKKLHVVFNPKLKDLIPMMSVLGGPPIPISTDPVKMFNQVLPQVQKRIMKALGDTGFWFPILIDFVRDHFLSLPAMQKALGGLDMRVTAKRLAIPGLQELKLKAGVIIETAQQEACASVGEEADKDEDKFKDDPAAPSNAGPPGSSKTQSLFKEQFGIIKAFKAPFAVLDEISSAVESVWPPLKAFLEAVEKSESEIPEVKDAMCSVQKKFFRGLRTVCARMDSIVALVGSKLEKLVALLDHGGAKVNCKDLKKDAKGRIDKIVKKLQMNAEGGLFAVCAYEPVLGGCPGGPESDEDSRTFMDDIFEFGQFLIDISSTEITGKEGGAAVKALVAVVSKEKAEGMKTAENKEASYSKIVDALKPLAELAKTSPLTKLAGVVSECRPLIVQSASTVKKLIGDLDKQFQRLRKLLSESNANPDTMVTQLSDFFNEVGSIARTHAADPSLNKEASAGCEEALKKLPGGGGTALAIFKAVKQIAPHLRTPMSRVADVANYLSTALECGARLIPPVKRATAIILGFIQGGDFSPGIIENAVKQLRGLFVEPLQCVTKDMVGPLEPLLAPYIKAFGLSPKGQEITEKIQSAKAYAQALSRGVKAVRELIAAGMSLYSNLNKMIVEVQKYRKAGSAGGVPPGLAKALSASRAFKKDLVIFVEPLRELRETLESFALDEGTVLNLLDAADKTLVGLTAGCDVVIKLVLNPPSKNDGPSSKPPSKKKGPSFLEIGEVKHSKRLSKSRRFRFQRTLQTESVHKQYKIRKSHETSKKPVSAEQLAELGEKIDVQTEKLDQLQESSDVMMSEMHTAGGGGGSGGGGGGGVKGSMSQEERAELKVQSRALLKKIETQQKKLKCPSTHTPMGTGAMRKLLLEKEIEILAETITVPPQSTYGVVVKISILVHAVGNIYIDALLCDCICTKDLKSPCTELLLVGPSMNLHILGVGSVSLTLAILNVKATAAIQLGSLMAQARLHIGRVANDPTKLCIKDLPPSEATFGGALTAGMDVQILSGRFVADVTVLGFSVVNPELEWDGLHWHLGSFCFEPSKTAKKLRRLTPGVCPSKAPLGFKQMLVTLETGDRKIARQAAERSCSVCHILQADDTDDLSRWSCEYPSLRALSLAGYSNVPDISGLGQHFLSFLKAARVDLELLLLDPNYGYFSKETSDSLKSELLKWQDGQEAPRLKRLFWDGASAAVLKGREIPSNQMKFRGKRFWGWISDVVKKAVQHVKKAVKHIKKAVTGSVIMKGLGGEDDNRLRYLSAIFLCSEQVDVVDSKLQYSGTVFMRYALSELLERHPDLEHKNSASDKPASSFEERYNLERDETQDITDNFVVGFAFKMEIPVGAGEETLERVQEQFQEGDVLKSPKTWKPQQPDNWIGEKKNGVNIQFQLLKAPMLTEMTELRKRWETKTCKHVSAAGTGTDPKEKSSEVAFLEEAMSSSRMKSRHGRGKHTAHRRRHGQGRVLKWPWSKKKEEKRSEPTSLIQKTTRQFMIYESNARVFTAPDEMSERISTKYPFEDNLSGSSKASYLYSLPGSENQFQITYNAAGTPGVGEVASSCSHPWLFKKSLQDMFTGGEPGSQMQEEMCRRTKELVMQEPLIKGGKRARHPIETYTHARTKAIQQFDAEPCADPSVTSWPTKRDDTSAEQLALGTQQCFPCVRNPSQSHIWKCPVVGRREGMVLGAEAQWLNSKRMNPSVQDDKKLKYGEGQYIRSLLYTMGQRVEKALNETYNVEKNEVTSMILCGERVARVLKDDAGERAFHYSALAYVMIDSPGKHKDLAEAADEDNLNLHILMLNQEFTAQDMETGNVVWSDTEDDGPKAFFSFIDNKCDPANLHVGVDAKSVAQELLCDASDAYTLVHTEVKMAFDKLRSEKNPCRINPKIKTRAYASEKSNYTFFGWRLGKMAEEGTQIVRTNKMCSMCQWDPPHKKESESWWSKAGNALANVFDKRIGNLRCNVNSKGETVEDQKPRLAVLNLFTEEQAKGTSAWRTLDTTVENAVRKIGLSSPKDSFWGKVYKEQVGKTESDIAWQERKSMIAVCDEIGMANIKVTKVNKHEPEKLMKTKGADTQLYGATICARLGWQTNCFQVLIPVEDITPLTEVEADKKEEKDESTEDWNGSNMLLWRGDKETEAKDVPALKMRDGGHAYFFQVFTGAAIAGELDGEDDEIKECPEIDDLQVPEASTQSHCDSDTIGRTEGYACKVIREDSNGRKVSDRVDLQRTCDDTMPTWETLEYSQRFKSKECLDLVINDGKK